jgi:hypothetical protein
MIRTLLKQPYNEFTVHRSPFTVRSSQFARRPGMRGIYDACDLGEEQALWDSCDSWDLWERPFLQAQTVNREL